MGEAVTRDDLDEARELVVEAGRRTLTWFRSASLGVDTKSDGSPVTAADRDAERFLRDELDRRHPDDAVHGEEEQDRPGTSGRTWVIDPIDGTLGFVAGVPLYSTLLALLVDERPVLGVIGLPAVDEVVAAGEGLGCWWNDRQVSVSGRTSLDGAVVTTSAFDHWDAGALDRLHRSPARMRTWGDGYGYAMVATGRAEAMVDPVIARHDVAPIPVIIGEAGGRYSDLRGDDVLGGSGLATNGLLHDEILSLVGPAS